MNRLKISVPKAKIERVHDWICIIVMMGMFNCVPQLEVPPHFQRGAYPFHDGRCHKFSISTGGMSSAGVKLNSLE